MLGFGNMGLSGARHWRATMGRLEPVGLLLGRLLIAGLFLHEAATLARDPGSSFVALARVGVPPPLAVATVVLQFAAGMSLVLGFRTRGAALALGLFCVATALVFHTPLASRNELLHFEKDLAIAGGLIVLACCGPGALSLDERRRRRQGPVPGLDKRSKP